MPADNSNTQYIEQILDPDELLIKSDLIRLSSFNESELHFLDSSWNNSDVKRRRRIASDLLGISMEHQSLDFSRIFTILLSDSDSAVRVKAIKGLAEEEDQYLIPRFVQLLHQDSAAEVRSAAAEALGKLAMLGELEKLTKERTEQVYRGLLETLDKKGEPINVKNAALMAIAPLEMPRVKGLIEEFYHGENPEQKIAAIYAMGLNCNRTWLTALTGELHNEDPEVRFAASRALGELAEEDSVLYLSEMVDDEDPRVQEAAIQSIGEIGGEEASEFLNMLLHDPRQKIRRAAKSALQETEFCENPLSTNF
jgi:HEAT repeat protein